MVERVQLRDKAAKYRAYACWIADAEIAQSILELASELEQRAMQPDEEDIRTHAYDLWRKAGKPENRDDEFWHLAEQQLRSSPTLPSIACAPGNFGKPRDGLKEETKNSTSKQRKSFANS